MEIFFFTEFCTKLSYFKENVKKKLGKIPFWGILREFLEHEHFLFSNFNVRTLYKAKKKKKLLLIF
jgi:hypothetical protein